MSFYRLNENNVLNQIKFHIDLIKIVFSVKTNISSSYKSELIYYFLAHDFTMIVLIVKC